ncbi:FBD-like protein [Tanacetum coccineum]
MLTARYNCTAYGKPTRLGGLDNNIITSLALVQDPACPSLVSLPCLKTLDIAVYSNPLENAFKLIHGCPILENLSLEVTRHESEENYYFEIPTLKRLTLSIFGSLKTNYKVELNLPNLEYLSISQDWLHSLLVIKDLSSLVEEKASCTTVYADLWYKLLKGICRAKCLSLYIRYSSFLFSNPLSLSLPEFPNVKHLELWSFNGPAWLLVPKIIEKSSKLEHFCINEVLKFMLVNSKVLKTLTVTFHTDLRLNDVGALSQVISRLPRASEDCDIHFETTPWRLVAGILIPGDMSPEISCRVKLEGDSFPGDTVGPT